MEGGFLRRVPESSYASTFNPWPVETLYEARKSYLFLNSFAACQLLAYATLGLTAIGLPDVATMLLFLAVVLTAGVLFAIGCWHSAKVVGGSKVGAAFCAIGLMVIPCGYVLGILYVVSKLNAVMLTSGVKVGLMGPSKESIEEYSQRLAQFKSEKVA